MRRNSTRNTDVAAAHLAKMHTEGHIKGFLQSADGVTVNTAIVANRGSDRQLVSGAQLGKNKAGRLRHRRRLVIVVAITGCVILVIVVAVTGCVIPVRRVDMRAWAARWFTWHEEFAASCLHRGKRAPLSGPRVTNPLELRQRAHHCRVR